VSILDAFRKALGRRGEDAAGKFLKSKGMKILDRNFRTDMGEIDIVAMDGDTVVFVEVKTRTNADKWVPEDAVDERKLRKIESSGRIFLKYFKKPYRTWRIDIVAIENSDGELRVTRHIAGA
jgi:putative endonuclease